MSVSGYPRPWELVDQPAPAMVDTSPAGVGSGLTAPPTPRVRVCGHDSAFTAAATRLCTFGGSAV